MLFIKAQLIKLRPLFKISLYKPNLMPAEGSCQAREGKLKSVCSGFRTMRSQSILKSEKKKKKGVCAFYVHQIASFLPIQSELCTYSRIFNLHKRYFCLFNLIYQKGKKKRKPIPSFSPSLFGGIQKGQVWAKITSGCRPWLPSWKRRQFSG